MDNRRMAAGLLPKGDAVRLLAQPTITAADLPQVVLDQLAGLGLIRPFTSGRWAWVR